MPRNVVLILVSAIVGGGLVWLFFGSGTKPMSPEDEPRETAKVPPRRPTSEPADRLDRSDRSTKSTRIADSNGRTEELEQFVEGLKDKVVVDLGTVEDIGKQTAAMLLSEPELARLKATSKDDLTPAESQRLLELERQKATALGVLPEITGFQDDPDQYARFFSSLLERSAGLDEAQTAAVFDYMKGRGEAMVAAGLNAANEPEDPVMEEAWEERRDQFNAATARGVAEILPPGEAERIGFTPGFMELLEQDFDKAD